ncbi:cupin domain-containing protein [Dyella subtropica]|uniref:cupin domain-containing protein n=1 Tax=Dyella subtropica TaxID=2992127 RepID=UPI0022586C7D|nr:cupin domain-containing protein [Dyella subtropica]
MQQTYVDRSVSLHKRFSYKMHPSSMPFNILATVFASLVVSSLGIAQPAHAGAAEAKTLLKTTQSWDGTLYPAYKPGQPEITVLHIEIPPHSTLGWHHHPVINAAYVLKGRLTVEKRDQGNGASNGLTTCSVATGDVLPELVDQVHRGYTGDEPVTLIVFYASTAGENITVPDAFPVSVAQTQPAPPCRGLKSSTSTL